MKKVNTYMANDGRIFTSAIECLKYEGVELNTSKDDWDVLEDITVIIEDKVINPIASDMLEVYLKYASVVKVNNEDSHSEVISTLCDIGRTTQGMWVENGKTFYYSEKLGGWICLEKMQNQIKEIMEKLG
jgi:hypothetical protein